MILHEAKNIAIDICYKLQPFTTRINIAGSIRRKKPEVKDIEIVLTPLMVASTSTSLLSDVSTGDVVHPNFVELVNSLGTLEKGKPTGRYCKIVLPQGINLDLFIPDPTDFFRQYAIRTGSADYSFKVIAHGWRKIGWVGSDLGLRLEKDCVETKQPDGKSKWTCVRNKNNTPPVWESEESFFNWLGVKMVAPELRNI